MPGVKHAQYAAECDDECAAAVVGKGHKVGGEKLIGGIGGAGGTAEVCGDGFNVHDKRRAGWAGSGGGLRVDRKRREPHGKHCEGVDCFARVFLSCHACERFYAKVRRRGQGFQN